MLSLEMGDNMTNKIEELSRNIVDYSIDVKDKEKVLITGPFEAKPLIRSLITKIIEKGGIPFVKLTDNSIQSLLLEKTNDDRIKELVNHSKFEVDSYDSFINIRYVTNDFEQINVNPLTRKKIGDASKKIDYIKINKRKWVLLNYPSTTDAYKAKMNSTNYQDYAFDVMTFNYREMEEMVKPLKELMEKTDKVRITGKDTDLSFSIKKIPIIPCCGKSNLPDGEIYTAPVKNSVNGKITYNVDSPYNGNIFRNVCLTFKDGKITEAKCNGDNEKLNEIFDTDEGARYIGEFSIGLNPKIMHPMGDILYDEKIIGSIHFTPGSSYEDAFNGNESSVHWDLVLIQRDEYGGGDIYFDDVLVRKNGIFVLPELIHLNYHLK